MNMETFKGTLGEVRVVVIEGEPWFVGKDVAEILGYSNTRDVLSRHVDSEDKIDGVVIHDSIGRTQTPILINESGLYSLILSSKLPTAKEFKRWITSEVLPSIRKHGAYLTPATLEDVMNDPDSWITLLTTLKGEREKNLNLQKSNSELTVKNQIMQPKAEYFDELVDRNLLTSFRETAKELEVKEKEFIKFLIDHKYVYRDKKGKLQPYTNRNNGLFGVKECFNEKTQWGGTQTLITPKGRETFRLLVTSC